MTIHRRASRRRKLMVAATIVALALAGYQGWAWLLAARFESRLAALRERGVPTSMSELARAESVPAEQDAALVLYRADRWYATHLLEDEPFDRDPAAEIAQWVERGQPYKELLQAAASLPHTRWKKGDGTTEFPSRKILGEACFYLDQRSRRPERSFADRLECVAIMLDLADKSETYTLFLALGEYGLDILAVSALEWASSRPDFDAARARRMLGARLDRALRKKKVARALRQGRARALARSRRWIQGELPDEGTADPPLPLRFGATWAGRAWAYSDAVAVLDLFERVEQLLELPFPEAYPEAVALGDELDGLGALNWVSRSYHTLSTRSVFGQARHTAHMQLARVALAVLEHRQATGAWPRKLREVAHLLGDAVPSDPFTDEALIYEPGLRVAARAPEDTEQDDRFGTEWRFD